MFVTPTPAGRGACLAGVPVAIVGDDCMNGTISSGTVGLSVLRTMRSPAAAVYCSGNVTVSRHAVPA